MSTDGQNFDHPVNPSSETQPQPAVNATEELAGQQSRRKFLRTAVISGVAVATVGTTAGVAAAAAQPHTGVLKKLGINNPFGSSPAGITCGMCFEASGLYGSISSFNVQRSEHNGKFKYNTQPGTFFVWFTAHNVPDGSYVIKITLDPNQPLSTSPFQYQSTGNNAFLFERDAGTANDCPNYSGSPNNGQLPTDSKRQAKTVPDLFVSPPPPSNPGPYTVSGGPKDLQVTAHISWRDDANIDSGDTIYHFTGEIFSSSDLSSPLCTSHVQVTAIKDY